jgi:5'(3')-deoxyribonucleotidase
MQGKQANRSNRRRLFVDTDGTLTEFLPQSSMAPLYEKGYFRHLPPHVEVVEAVKLLILQYPQIEVFALSAYLIDSPYALQEKNEWMDAYLPQMDAAHRIFVPNGADKRAYVHEICEDDVLLDDYTKNLLRWQPSRGIKLINAINHTKKTWNAAMVHYDRPAALLAADILRAMDAPCGKEGIYENRL